MTRSWRRDGGALPEAVHAKPVAVGVEPEAVHAKLVAVGVEPVPLQAALLALEGKERKRMRASAQRTLWLTEQSS